MIDTPLASKWEPTDSNVYFQIPGGLTGRIYIPERDEASAMARFNAKWPAILEVAVARRDRGQLENGEVVLDFAMF